MEAYTLITNYKALFSTEDAKTKNKQLLKDLFAKAKQIKFNNLDFPVSTDNYQLHLGYDGTDLYGILIKSNKNVFFGNVITSKTIVSKFENTEFIVPNNLITRLQNPTEITYDEVVVRKSKLKEHLNSLIDNSLNKNEMVEYFLIDKANFKAGNNTSIITITNDVERGSGFRFDMVTINEAYMDTVRPVPPFKPYTWVTF